MASIFRKIAQKVLLKVIPEMKHLFVLDEIVSSKKNSTISKKATLTEPHYIQDSTIDDYTYVGFNARITCNTIGKFCSIGPNFMSVWGIHPLEGVSTSPMFYSTVKQNGYSLTKKTKVVERKPVTIGNDVFIGMNVTILDGLKIGDGAVIGAGSVVIRDVPPYAIVAGVPAKVIRYRFSEKQIEDLLAIKWWNFPEEKLKLVEEYFFNMDMFIQHCKKIS